MKKDYLSTYIYSTKLYWALFRLQTLKKTLVMFSRWNGNRGKGTSQEGFIDEMRVELYFEGKNRN